MKKYICAECGTIAHNGDKCINGHDAWLEREDLDSDDSGVTRFVNNACVNLKLTRAELRNWFGKSESNQKTYLVVNEKNQWVYLGRHANPDEVDDELHEQGMIAGVEYYVYELADFFPVATIKILKRKTTL